MRQKSNCLVIALWAVAWTFMSVPSSALADATFSVTGTTVTPGVGDTIIKKYYPSLSGQVSGSDVEQLMNSAIQTALPTFKNQVEQNLAFLNDTSDFLSAMANSGSAAGKMMPFDYVTDPTYFSLSVAGGVAEHGFPLGDLSNSIQNYNVNTTQPLPAQGGGATFSAQLGINLRAFDPPRLDYFDFSRLSLFLNFFTIDLNEPNGASFDLSFQTFGLHGMYQLFDSKAVASSGLLRWGGLAVGTGFDYSTMTVLYDATIQPTLSKQQSGSIGNTSQTMTLDLTYSGAAKIGANVDVFSIPFEVMTHVQIAYILSIYVGGAFDLNFGSATLAGNASAPVTIAVENPNDSSDTVTVAAPDAKINLAGSNGVTVADFRAYGGVQLNLLAVAVFAQGSVDTTNTFSANAGLRLFW